MSQSTLSVKSGVGDEMGSCEGKNAPTEPEAKNQEKLTSSGKRRAPESPAEPSGVGVGNNSDAVSSEAPPNKVAISSEAESSTPSASKVAERVGTSQVLDHVLTMLDPELDKKNVQAGSVHGFRLWEDDLNSYTILGGFSLEHKKKVIDLALRDSHLNRVMGSICGMGIGDALGHPFEFMAVQDTVHAGGPHFDLETMTFHGEVNAFCLRRGQWTDDAAMGLCMADSLIMRRGFDGSDMRVRFWCWWNRGYNNSFRKDPSRTSSVGLGGNIAKSLNAVTKAKGGPISEVYQADTEDAGNGSLMRFAPIAIFYHASPMKEVYDIARRSSYTSHPGIIAAEACAFLAHLLVRALQLPSGEPKCARTWLVAASEEYLELSGLSEKSGWGYDQMKQLVKGQPEDAKERCWAWRENELDIKEALKARGSKYNGYPVSSGYFGAYSLDGLAMSLWSVYHTTNFDEAVTKSVNLLGDADSHGSITGQLAGALYGYKKIKPQFKAWLNEWDENEFAVRGLLLSHLGTKRCEPI